jgi:hypothetical protein
MDTPYSSDQIPEILLSFFGENSWPFVMDKKFLGRVKEVHVFVVNAAKYAVIKLSDTKTLFKCTYDCWGVWNLEVLGSDNIYFFLTLESLFEFISGLT